MIRGVLNTNRFLESDGHAAVSQSTRFQVLGECPDPVQRRNPQRGAWCGRLAGVVEQDLGALRQREAAFSRRDRAVAAVIGSHTLCKRRTSVIKRWAPAGNLINSCLLSLS